MTNEPGKSLTRNFVTSAQVGLVVFGLLAGALLSAGFPAISTLMSCGGGALLVTVLMGLGAQWAARWTRSDIHQR